MAGWQPIETAPKTGGDDVPPFAYGPWLILRGPASDDRQVRARWRPSISGYDIQTDESGHSPGRWQDGFDKPISFEPVLWMPDEER